VLVKSDVLFPKAVLKTFAAILFCGFVVLAASAATVPAATNYVEGEVLVTFKKSQNLDAVEQALGRHSLKLDRHFDALSRRSGHVMGFIREHGRTTASLIAELKQDPDVQDVDPNYIRHICGAVPNDPYFPQQWGLTNIGQIVNGSPGIPGADIRFPAAWALARPSTNEVVVGVIDTGIDYTHPDLVSNLWVNPYAGQDAAYGFPGEDLYGYNCIDTNAAIFDSGWHGTHVAGILAAVGNNHLGIIGADYQAKIMTLKVSDDGQTTQDRYVEEAINFAITMLDMHGINVVALNASFAGAGEDITLRTAIEEAGFANIIFCAAADNNSTDIDDNPDYPASYDLPNMIVVAASDQTDNLASFSNYGANSVHIAAPGVNILSTIPFNQTNTTASVMEGTNDYSALGLTDAGVTTNITATIYDCGSGHPGDFPVAVSNNIALLSLDASGCSNEVANAMAAGAVAAIVYNNTAGNFTGSLATPNAWIPAVSIAQADGQTIRATLPAVGSVANAIAPSQYYAYHSGTSQATPLVSAAVAFAAMNFPNETMAGRIARILTNVDVDPYLSGDVITGGRLNLQRTVDTDGNGLPDWWEQTYFGSLTGTDPNADPDGDGLSNIQEWQAGTDPTDASSCLRLMNINTRSAGTTLTWQSVDNRNYFVTRGTNVAGSAAYPVIATNLPGQAGATVYTTTNNTGRGCWFYRVGTGLDPFP
jgi:subtilisin family serine protease